MDSELILKILEDCLKTGSSTFGGQTSSESIKLAVQKIVGIPGGISCCYVDFCSESTTVYLELKNRHTINFFSNLLEGLRDFRPEMTLYYNKERISLAEYCFVEILGLNSFHRQQIGDFVYYTFGATS